MSFWRILDQQVVEPCNSLLRRSAPLGCTYFSCNLGPQNPSSPDFLRDLNAVSTTIGHSHMANSAEPPFWQQPVLFLACPQVVQKGLQQDPKHGSFWAEVLVVVVDDQQHQQTLIWYKLKQTTASAKIFQYAGMYNISYNIKSHQSYLIYDVLMYFIYYI